MRYAVCAAAVLIVSCAAFGAEAKAEGTYELHEWGVFSVPRGDAWAQRDMKQEWASFPSFFNRVWPDTNLPYRGAVKKPVIYLHATGKLSVELTVRFAQGRPLVWWPPAEYPAGGIPMNNLDRVSFQLELVKPRNEEMAPKPREVDKGHWVEALRAVNSSMLFADNGFGRANGGIPPDGGAIIAEHFVYYDGVTKAPPAPKVTRDGQAVTIESNCDHSMLDVLVIERTEKELRLSKVWIAKIEPGAQKTRTEMEKAVEGPAAELIKRLAAAGLNKDEAEALVKVWNEGFFKQDGLHVLYRVPQETYEKWLPLEAKPAPTKTVRVGLVLHEHLEPELDARVEGLIKKLGSESFEARNAAQAELAKIGGAAFPALEKAAQGEDAEISKACRSILAALDVRPVLDGLKKDAQK